MLDFGVMGPVLNNKINMYDLTYRRFHQVQNILFI